LGIGGWIGVGKSTICSFFKEELCADVLSLDSISHELYEVPSFFGFEKRFWDVGA